MPNYSKHEIILVQYPFSDLSNSKIRPAVIVNAPHQSQDVLIVPLTSRTSSLLSGEFILTDWSNEGLKVKTAVKRGIFTIQSNLILRSVGKLSEADAQQLTTSLKHWLGFS
jgi:mRNA interferase MazF